MRVHFNENTGVGLLKDDQSVLHEFVLVSSLYEIHLNHFDLFTFGKDPYSDKYIATLSYGDKTEKIKVRILNRED